MVKILYSGLTGLRGEKAETLGVGYVELGRIMAGHDRLA